MTTAPSPAEVAEILGQSAHPLIAFDVDSLSILGANEAACDLVGRDSRSLAGVATTDLMSPVDVRAGRKRGGFSCLERWRVTRESGASGDLTAPSSW